MHAAMGWKLLFKPCYFYLLFVFLNCVQDLQVYIIFAYARIKLFYIMIIFLPSLHIEFTVKVSSDSLHKFCISKHIGFSYLFNLRSDIIGACYGYLGTHCILYTNSEGSFFLFKHLILKDSNVPPE